MSYSKSKPSNYVTKEQIERARNVDMVEFLERTEGFSVKKSGNGYRCDVHDSLFITNDRKGWYWNSRDEGGNNAIAFCMKIYGQSFTEAVKSLCGDIQMEYSPKYNTKRNRQKKKLICTPKVRHIWRCIFLWAKQEEKTKRTRQNSKSML
ncbi:MAG: hypothetical protein ACLTZI_04990 [[Eubacterium] siraeum]